VDGTIRANGESTCRSGAGGSVWIRSNASLAGTGSIEVMGGTSTCGVEAGGGGAVAVEYGTLEAGATLLGNLRGQGGPGGVAGGAGTAYARSAAQSYGELTVDNGTLTGNRRTILPALGSGIAQPGSGGATLVTGRAKAIPPYFVGHWVEIRAAATGALKGTWRIAAISADSLTVTLSVHFGSIASCQVFGASSGERTLVL